MREEKGRNGGSAGDMQIVGYCIHGNKQYVVFRGYGDRAGQYRITDGFHDRHVNERNAGKYRGYQCVDRQEVDMERITNRLRGARPWHPLLKLLGRGSR